MIEVLLPAGVAICAAFNVANCTTLNSLHAELFQNHKIGWVAAVCPDTDAKCSSALSAECVAISRVFFDEDDARRYRFTSGWFTWYSCPVPAGS